MITVNQASITEEQVLSEMQYFPAPTQRKAMLEAAQSLIIGELLLQRAKALSLSRSNDEMGSKEDYLEQLIESEVPIPQATPEECLQYFEQNPHRFTTSPLVEANHIMIAAAPDDLKARAEGKLIAEQLIEQLHQKANFAALAQEFSACPSKSVGGSLGQLSRGQTVPEFERQLLTAEIGLQPYPIESRYGFHIVDIKHKIAGNPLPFEAVSDKINLYLNEKVRQKAIAQYIQMLINEANIEGFDFETKSEQLLQ
ncbi:peptidylprolyl isomerase [Shewanella profunda]|uniref:peptidylprolyl isomerase n=1 Tax=Shewanella profunda TaxID=254793 RepID=UPI00200C03ED|nr:peptidylprolyl isomerase [Shewanella profunda]MCL1089899.1 peptidylprolyl isomerase [Shewanella profunda]